MRASLTTAVVYRPFYFPASREAIARQERILVETSASFARLDSGMIIFRPGGAATRFRFGRDRSLEFFAADADESTYQHTEGDTTRFSALESSSEISHG